MSFFLLGQPMTLIVNVSLDSASVSAQQLKRSTQTQSISALFALTTSLTHPSTSSSPLHFHETPTPPQITSIITQFPKIFHEPNQLPPSRTIQHHIHLTPNINLVNVKPYRYPHFQKPEIEQQVSLMLNAELIQPSHSCFSSLVLFVKKKDGSWRCCVNYKALNAIMITDRFPMPIIDKLLDELGHASWFSKLDLRQGFPQIRMEDSDIHKAAFKTHHGHFEFKVMPFGLCHAPSTFQASMNDTLHPFLRKFVAVFFDDILIYNPYLQSNAQHLQQVLSTLSHAQFLLHQPKCLFAQQKLHYLSHIVSFQGVSPDPDKIPAMLTWPAPSTPSALCGFLGLTGIY